MTALDNLAALTVVVIWGLNFVAAKLGIAVIPPLLLTGVRFVIVAAVLAPFFRIRRSEILGTLLISTLLGVGHFGFIFLGMTGVDAATAAITVQLQAPFSALVAVLFFNDRLPAMGWFGMALAFGGVALLAGEPTLPALGPMVLLVLACLAWALANVAVKKLGNPNPVALNGWMCLFGAPQLFLLSWLFEDDQASALLNAGWQGWGALAFTAFCSSIIAYTLWYRLLGRHSMNVVVPFTLLAPVIGILSGVVFLGEVLTWQKLVGGALTIGGVAIIQLGQRRQSQAGRIVRQ